MKLLIDANVLLDVLQNRAPYVQASAAVWKLCETEQATGYVSALTVANLVDIMRRELDPEQIADILLAIISVKTQKSNRPSFPMQTITFCLIRG